MAAKTTRRPTRQPVRRQPVRRDPLLVRAARASLTRYDRRVIGLVVTRYYRVTGALARRLHITPVRARTLGYALLVLVVLVALGLQAEGVGR